MYVLNDAILLQEFTVTGALQTFFFRAAWCGRPWKIMRNSHLITGIEVHVMIAGRGITSLNVLSWRYQLRRETCSVAGWNFRKASDTGTQIPRLFLWQISITDISCIAINVDPFYKYITICLKFCMLHICVCWGRFCPPPPPNTPPTHTHTHHHHHYNPPTTPTPIMVYGSDQLICDFINQVYIT